jgi:hypothetical protein
MRESRDFRERGNVGCELDNRFLVGGDRMRMRGRCVGLMRLRLRLIVVSTSDAYNRSVKEGKAWVAEWAGGVEVSGLASAFDVVNENTPKALHAFVVYKCEIMENSYKTAEAIRSAFKHYFT